MKDRHYSVRQQDDIHNFLVQINQHITLHNRGPEMSILRSYIRYVRDPTSRHDVAFAPVVMVPELIPIGPDD